VIVAVPALALTTMPVADPTLAIRLPAVALHTPPVLSSVKVTDPIPQKVAKPAMGAGALLTVTALVVLQCNDAPVPKTFIFIVEILLSELHYCYFASVASHSCTPFSLRSLSRTQVKKS